MTFRSVIVFGRMRVLEDGEASLRLARLLGEKFTQDAAYLDNEVKHAGPRMLIRDLSNSGYRIAEIPCCVAPSAEEGIHRQWLKADGYGKICLDGKHYYSTQPENSHQKVLILYGPVGTGKTHLAIRRRKWGNLLDRKHISAHPLCEECLGLGGASVATLMHYVKPLADGGTNDERNLRSLCVSCHEKIHRRKKKDG